MACPSIDVLNIPSLHACPSISRALRQGQEPLFCIQPSGASMTATASRKATSIYYSVCIMLNVVTLVHFSALTADDGVRDRGNVRVTAQVAVV
jgi:hypothetical protein